MPTPVHRVKQAYPRRRLVFQLQRQMRQTWPLRNKIIARYPLTISHYSPRKAQGVLSAATLPSAVSLSTMPDRSSQVGSHFDPRNPRAC
jgi:hypothetical protein